MKPEGIKSRDIHLFQTTDGDWRVLDDSRINSDYTETLYWNSSLKDAMRTFGWATARKSRNANNGPLSGVVNWGKPTNRI